jgi:hypothetical protein
LNPSTGASSPFINPRNSPYNGSCAGNSSIDDSAAITAALVTAQATGGTVLIPGICYVANPIIWPNVGVSPDVGFGMVGISTGGVIRAMSTFPNTGPASALIYRQDTASTGPGNPVTISNVTLDCNTIASAAVTFEEQRQLIMSNGNTLSCTGNGGGEMNFGLASGSHGEVGLMLNNWWIDNSAIVASLGASSRPNYGIYLNSNAADGTFNTIVVNQNKLGGVYNNASNNKFFAFHPWGYSSLQGSTWPQNGMVQGPEGFNMTADSTQCDTIQDACFLTDLGYLKATNTIVECNDGGTGSLCEAKIVDAPNNVNLITLLGGIYEAGTLSPSGSPINNSGTVGCTTTYLTDWQSQQIAPCGSPSVINLPSININGTVTASGSFGTVSATSLTVSGGSTFNGGFTVNGNGAIQNGSGNVSYQLSSSMTNTFPYLEVGNGTNSWDFVVLGSAGGVAIQDNSTNHQVITAAMGAPSASIAVDASGRTTMPLLTLTAANALTLSAMTGTACLEEVSGVVTSTGSACGSGGGGDTITSPNSTLSVGGSSSATTLDLAGSAGEIMAGATPALTYTPSFGKSGTAGTLSLFPASGNFTTTLGSAATASNVVNFFAAVPTNNHLFYCAVSSITCTLTDAGYAYNAIPLADLATQATNSIVANVTSGTAVPTAVSVSGCSAAGDALIWTTNTGPGCNTSITAAAAPLSGITGLGTGVTTALSNALNGASGLVGYSGALGTPSSGTLTNATGLPAASVVAGALANTMQATTQSAGDSTADLATDSFVTTAVANAVAGVNPAVAVLAASTATITGTYAQVGGGIGDTFTVTATGAFTLDGIAINTIGQRVLLKNQSSANQNGIYTATIVGTTGISAVFTRALDYDTPSDVNNTGSIPVQSGTVNTTTSWLLTSQVTSIGSSGSSLTYAQFSLAPANLVTAVSPGVGLCHFAGSTQACTSSAVVGGDMTNNTVTATQLATQYSKGSCTEAWGGSGTSHALTSGDDAVVNNTCYNDSGVTRTITAVKCRNDNASNTTTVNPTFGSAGTGTTILSGALTCGNSYAYSSTGTVSNASWTTGTGIDPVMGGTLTGTSIAVIVEYTY